MAVIRRDDWERASRSKEFAQYILRARRRFERGERLTANKVRTLYRRVAEQVRQEIEQVTPGTLRHAHLSALAAALDKIVRALNDELLAAVMAGIQLASREATSGAEQVTLELTKDVFPAAQVVALFAGVNQRAVLATWTRTYNDGLKLSDRVWRTSTHAREALRRLVEDGVARGLNARVLAREVQQYLQPGVFTALKEETRKRLKVPRDVSMEAMRLAVTEMQHAFHEGTVLAYQTVPSCNGFYWRLSGSHPVPDICDTYANRGGNGFWRVDEVPPKPHPWCRCILVPAMEEPRQFVRRLKEWANDPGSHPDIERWYQSVQHYLERPTMRPA